MGRVVPVLVREVGRVGRVVGEVVVVVEVVVAVEVVVEEIARAKSPRKGIGTEANEGPTMRTFRPHKGPAVVVVVGRVVRRVVGRVGRNLAIRRKVAAGGVAVVVETKLPAVMVGQPLRSRT